MKFIDLYQSLMTFFDFLELLYCFIQENAQFP